MSRACRKVVLFALASAVTMAMVMGCDDDDDDSDSALGRDSGSDSARADVGNGIDAHTEDAHHDDASDVDAGELAAPTFLTVMRA